MLPCVIHVARTKKVGAKTKSLSYYHEHANKENENPKVNMCYCPFLMYYY